MVGTRCHYFGDCDILNAFVDVTIHSHSVLINVHVLASGCRFSEDAPVCAFETVGRASVAPSGCSDLLCYRFCSLQQWAVCWSKSSSWKLNMFGQYSVWVYMTEVPHNDKGSIRAARLQFTVGLV